MEHWSSDIDSDGIAWLCLDKAGNPGCAPFNLFQRSPDGDR